MADINEASTKSWTSVKANSVAAVCLLAGIAGGWFIRGSQNAVLTGAVVALIAYGSVWLSVRGQHPYSGPTSSVLPFVWGFVILNFAATVGFRRHAIAGFANTSNGLSIAIFPSMRLPKSLV